MAYALLIDIVDYKICHYHEFADLIIKKKKIIRACPKKVVGVMPVF